ncbi:MAG: hypothetical protein ACLT8E_07190 [Akkermansia sp.]
MKAGDQILTLGHEDEHHHLRSRLRHAHRFCVSAGDTVQEGQALAKIG